MLNKKITISVVLPLYNKRKTVIETLRSVIKQSRQADEIIVVDDGSSDGGAQYIERQFGAKVTIIKQCNHGVSAARNCGFRAASGEYIAFLDADDLWSPQYLEEVELLANAYPECGLIGTRYQYIDSDEKYVNPHINFCKSTRAGKKPVLSEGIMPSYFATAASGDLPFNASTVTIKRSLLHALEGFPEGEIMGEDQDVWARVALCSTIAYTPKVLGFYHRGAKNRCCNQSLPSQECPFSRRLKCYAQTCDDKALAEDILDYTTAHICYLAKQNILSGNYQAAKALLAEPRCWRRPARKILLNTLRLCCRAHDVIRAAYQQILAKVSAYNRASKTMINKEAEL